MKMAIDGNFDLQRHKLYRDIVRDCESNKT